MNKSTFAILITILFFSMANSGLAKQESSNSTGSSTKINSFDIKLTNSTTVTLQDFSNKPIVLNWGASWCPICQANLKTMNNIYASAKPYFNFLTVSYGGSGDRINDIIGLKNIGPYNWSFGFDSTNAASRFQVIDGYLWIINTNLQLVNYWNYTIVPQSQLVDAMNALLASSSSSSSTSSSDTISSNTSSNVPLPITGTGSLSLLFLLNNPLFLLFGGVVSIGLITMAVLRFYPRRH